MMYVLIFGELSPGKGIMVGFSDGLGSSVGVCGDSVGVGVADKLGSIAGVCVGDSEGISVDVGEGEIVGDGDGGGFIEVPVVNCHVLFVVGL